MNTEAPIPIPAISPESFEALCQFCVEHLLTPEDALRCYAGLPSPEPFLIPPEVMDHRWEVGRFLDILRVLYKKGRRRFEEVAPTLHGSRRRYFGHTAEEVSSSGSSNAPKRIPDTPWFASSNSWGPRKAAIVYDLMVGMGFSRDYARMVSSVCASKTPDLTWEYAQKRRQNRSA
ncbi:MAG: hypothetical protein ACLQU3_26705 [Limisphaerales bacterium]